MSGSRSGAGEACSSCGAAAAWSTLSPTVREEIDDLLCHGRNIAAIVAFRDHSGIRPKPGIDEGIYLIAHRHEVLSEQGRIIPKPDTLVQEALAKVEAFGARPVAVEARWLEESRGWCVGLGVILRQPSRWHPLFDERGLAWFPPVDDSGRSAAEKAVSTGQAVADRLGVPFHFADQDVPDTGYPRWWDTHGARSANLTS